MYTVSVTKPATMGKLCLNRFYYSKREGTEKKTPRKKRNTKRNRKRKKKERKRRERQKMETFKSKIVIGQNWFRNSPPHLALQRL